MARSNRGGKRPRYRGSAPPPPPPPRRPSSKRPEKRPVQPGPEVSLNPEDVRDMRQRIQDLERLSVQTAAADRQRDVAKTRESKLTRRGLLKLLGGMLTIGVVAGKYGGDMYDYFVMEGPDRPTLDPDNINDGSIDGFMQIPDDALGIGPGVQESPEGANGELSDEELAEKIASKSPTGKDKSPEIIQKDKEKALEILNERREIVMRKSISVTEAIEHMEQTREKREGIEQFSPFDRKAKEALKKRAKYIHLPNIHKDAFLPTYKFLEVLEKYQDANFDITKEGLVPLKRPNGKPVYQPHAKGAPEADLVEVKVPSLIAKQLEEANRRTGKWPGIRFGFRPPMLQAVMYARTLRRWMDDDREMAQKKGWNEKQLEDSIRNSKKFKKFVALPYGSSHAAGYALDFNGLKVKDYKAIDDGFHEALIDLGFVGGCKSLLEGDRLHYDFTFSKQANMGANAACEFGQEVTEIKNKAKKKIKETGKKAKKVVEKVKKKGVKKTIKDGWKKWKNRRK